MAVNIGADRYGADQTVGYKKPTGALTAAQRYNQSKSNRYPLNNYEADFRFRNSGAFGLGKKKTGSFNFPLGGFGGRGAGGARFAEEDFERQKELDRLVWERSTLSTTL